jgi:hypothetical protein
MVHGCALRDSAPITTQFHHTRVASVEARIAKNRQKVAFLLDAKIVTTRRPCASILRFIACVMAAEKGAEGVGGLENAIILRTLMRIAEGQSASWDACVRL